MAPTSAQARAAVLRSWAHTPDRAARTAAARAASIARFEREVDPDGVLSVQERATRAEFARKAFMTEMSIKAVAARRAKAGGLSQSTAQSEANGGATRAERRGRQVA